MGVVKKIGIIDADLIGRTNHRFPNLACMKLSGYYKDSGHLVDLLLDYDKINSYDKVFVSKVFTDTPFPDYLINHKNVEIGGTGFYFDKAPNLAEEIEHHMPDYSLYEGWIENEVKKAKKCKGSAFNYKTFIKQFKEYREYSIGFLTRGCFRKCPFCVNKKYDKVFPHSPLDEFYDSSRKKICLLDDNFLGCPEWRSLLKEIIDTGKPFKFKQGLDERLLTDEKCDLLFNSKYDGDFTFAFDNIEDYDLIHKKIKMIRSHTQLNKICFYVLVGFKSTDEKDIENAFKRIALLLNYKCLPYVMRYMDKNRSPWKESKFRSMYITLARWCNQPSILKKMTFREFCEANQSLHKTRGTLCSAMKALTEFETSYPSIAGKYFDIRFGEKNGLI